jgi:hypothetical protein
MIGQHRAECPAAANRHPTGKQSALARLSQRGVADLAAVAFEIEIE